MSLRRRIRALWLGVTLGVTFASFIAARARAWDPIKIALTLLLPLVLVLVAVQVAMLRGAQRRMAQALAREDLPALRKEVAELIEFFRAQPRVREMLRTAQGQILILDGHNLLFLSL